MKIRIVKASGDSIELSDVAGVEVIECGPIAVNRYDHFTASRSFTFELKGDGSGVGVYDSNIPWPLPAVVYG